MDTYRSISHKIFAGPMRPLRTQILGVRPLEALAPTATPQVEADKKGCSAVDQALVRNTKAKRSPKRSSNRRYSGCNVILLWLTRGQGWATPRFLTFKQAQEVGGVSGKENEGPRFTSSSSFASLKPKKGKPSKSLCRRCANTASLTSPNAKDFLQALSKASQQGFAIQMGVIHLRMNSLPQAGQSSARVQAPVERWRRDGFFGRHAQCAPLNTAAQTRKACFATGFAVHMSRSKWGSK